MLHVLENIYFGIGLILTIRCVIQYFMAGNPYAANELVIIVPLMPFLWPLFVFLNYKEGARDREQRFNRLRAPKIHSQSNQKQDRRSE